MKNSQIVLVSLTAAFLCILLGLYIGRNTTLLMKVSDNTSIGSAIDSNTSQQVGIDINTATVSQLQILPGIGEALAQNIVDYREANGPFTSMEELLNVKGIGETRLKEIQDRFYISQSGN